MHQTKIRHIQKCVTILITADLVIISAVYLEMSPQYHSASLSKLLFPLVTDEAMALALGGLGGRAIQGKKDKYLQ